MTRIESLKNFIDNQPSMFLDADATYNAIEELERLAEIGKATEEAYRNGYVMAEVEQILNPANNNLLITVCHHAFGTIEGLVTILKWGKEAE